MIANNPRDVRMQPLQDIEFLPHYPVGFCDYDVGLPFVNESVDLIIVLQVLRDRLVAEDACDPNFCAGVALGRARRFEQSLIPS